MNESETYFCPRCKSETNTGAPCEECGFSAAIGSLSFDPEDPEILWILGRPNFECAPIAHVLQASGHQIDRKAEAEQAAVIIWMIRKYQEHGANWKEKADEELSALVIEAKRKANETALPSAGPTNNENGN